MHKFNFRSLYLILLLPETILAANTFNNDEVNQPIKWTQTSYPGAELQLQTRDAALPQILKTISKKTGTTLHYSVLPSNPVTATCVGTNVTQILGCLLGSRINLVSSTSTGQNKKNQQQTTEIWILGSSLHECQDNSTLTNPAAQPLRPNAVDIQLTEPDGEEQLLQAINRTKAKDPRVRSQAITAMSNNREVDEATLNHILQEALSDDDAEVRSQALSGLYRREGNAANDVIQRALLSDRDAGVRLRALGYVKNDSALLEQALNDNDENVRLLAKRKLSVLNPD